MAAPSPWKESFADALRDVFSAQCTAVADLPMVPDVDEYLELKGNLTGLWLLTSFVEIVEGLKLSGGNPDENAALLKLRETTISIISLSWVCIRVLFVK